MARIDVRGRIIPNDYKFYFDFFGEDSTCPRDIRKVLDTIQPGEPIEVYVNSGGGVIDVGSEIYTLLRTAAAGHDVKIYVVGEACSAASVIAMAAYCEMSPTALMMVHCTSTSARGNHTALEHTAGVLATADKALCTAYMEKTGLTEEEILEMMEQETWLTAAQAKEKGLIDAVMFEEKEPEAPVTMAASMFHLPSAEQLAEVRKLIDGGKGQQEENELKEKKAAECRWKLLAMRRRRN